MKKGISKFEFHLIGCHFLIEMDMSSFPNMLKFKQKDVPHPQLLRWSEWFSKYFFDCKHIKGKTNVLADFLTRPSKEVMMYSSSASSSKSKQVKDSQSVFSMPPNLNPNIPPEVLKLVLEKKFYSKARDMIFEYQLEVFREHGGSILKPQGLHPHYPFIHPLYFKQMTEVPEELK